MSVHINWARHDLVWVETCYCPGRCMSDQPILIEHQEWYGMDCTCLTCGDRWGDGEMCERPFERGWRARQVRGAWNRGERYGRFLDTLMDALLGREKDMTQRLTIESYLDVVHDRVNLAEMSDRLDRLYKDAKPKGSKADGSVNEIAADSLKKIIDAMSVVATESRNFKRALS